MKRQPKKKILIILHRATSSPGRVGQFLQKNGFELDIRRPVLGEILPDTLTDYVGSIVFGGPMSANENTDFITRERILIDIALKENKPFLGICLGAQLLAKNIGAEICHNEEGKIEAGWYTINATEKGKELMDWPQMVYHFHNEGIANLPKSVELLATGQTFTTQAFRYGDNIWGIQFHAELTRVMMQRWVVHGANFLTNPNAQPPSQHLDGRFIYDQALKQWLMKLLNTLFIPAHYS